MPSCPKCGSFIKKTTTKCPFCDAKIIQITNEDDIVFHTPELDDIETPVDKEQLPSLEVVPERKYWIWLLIGFATVGVGFLIYLFINIEDLERHSNYPNDLRAEPIEVSASQSMMIFLVAILFGFIPILWWIYFKKYASLYYHLKDQKRDLAPRKIIKPIFYMIPLILSHLIALIPTIIGFITKINLRLDYPAIFWSILALVAVLTAFNLVLDFYWQRAFNAHLKLTMAKIRIEEEHL